MLHLNTEISQSVVVALDEDRPQAVAAGALGHKLAEA
jgi:hypothetical protein